MRAVAKAVVEQSPAEVWAELSAHEGMSSWIKGLVVTLDKEGLAERNGVGAVRRIKQPGPAPTIVEEITVFEPDARLGYKALSGVPFKGYSGEVTLAPSGTGTAIAWTLTADRRVPGEGLLLGTVAKVLLKALTGALKRTA